MISKTLAKNILNIATSTGADFAEIFYEDTWKKSFLVENGKLDTISNGNIYGVGLRIIKDLKLVYGYTNDVSKSGLEKLAIELSSSFEGERTIDLVEDLTNKKYKKVHKKVSKISTVPVEEITNLLKDTNNKIKSFDERIIQCKTGFASTTSSITIFNTKGEIFKKETEYLRMSLFSIASENGKLETRFDGPGTQAGWEYFTKTLDLDVLIKEHASKLILMLGAKECPSGKMPVIIGNGWGGVIFHEACGHQLEATAVAKNLSVFSNMIGEKIASDVVTAYDNGTLANEWGSNDIDDCGHPTQNNLLIENGILKGYLIDDFNGRRMHQEGNGATRRENYKYIPTSRMSNTYIANGKSTPEEIIKNTKLGIYAVSFNGGSVNPSTGEFNFGCSEAYIIKDGEIKEPVRGATLIGSAQEILKHIDMVGNDLAHGQGMCGSSSGSIPTNVGQPTIRVDEILVGGRGGNINEF